MTPLVMLPFPFLISHDYIPELHTSYVFPNEPFQLPHSSPCLLARTVSSFPTCLPDMPYLCSTESSPVTVVTPNTKHQYPFQVPCWLVLDLTLVSFVDSMGAAVLKQLHRDLRAAGVKLCLASASGKGYKTAKYSGIFIGLDGPHMAALVNLSIISYNNP